METTVRATIDGKTVLASGALVMDRPGTVSLFFKHLEYRLLLNDGDRSDPHKIPITIDGDVMTISLPWLSTHQGSYAKFSAGEDEGKKFDLYLNGVGADNSPIMLMTLFYSFVEA